MSYNRVGELPLLFLNSSVLSAHCTKPQDRRCWSLMVHGCSANSIDCALEHKRTKELTWPNQIPSGTTIVRP